ncbi:hypothetical protein ACFRAE_17375 [Sphingobacterium sp. HJSM2_6]|uniref:hypothetical protein n=1 Tax=Sphingobacterium sp. HJSM2_6 TaxID=3366264 RepID=UPI003BE109FE
MKVSKKIDKSIHKLYSKYEEINERYSSRQKKITINIHAHIRYLCAILDITPEHIVQEYLNSLAYSHKQNATKKQRKLSNLFFLSCRTDKSNYHKKEIRQMLMELEQTQKQQERSFTLNMDMNENNLYFAGQNIFNEKWVQWWFKKHRNQQKISVLDKI